MKRAVVTLSLDSLEQVLALKQDVHLRAVRDNWQHMGIDLFLEGEGLDIAEYEAGTEPCRVQLSDVLTDFESERY